MSDKKPLSLPQHAGMLCNQKSFIAYLREKNKAGSVPMNEAMYPNSAEWAADYIRCKCGIESRAYLASNPVAANKFQNIVKDFDSWNLQNQYSDNISRMDGC